MFEWLVRLKLFEPIVFVVVLVEKTVEAEHQVLVNCDEGASVGVHAGSDCVGLAHFLFLQGDCPVKQINLHEIPVLENETSLVLQKYFDN